MLLVDSNCVCFKMLLAFIDSHFLSCFCCYQRCLERFRQTLCSFQWLKHLHLETDCLVCSRTRIEFILPFQYCWCQDCCSRMHLVGLSSFDIQESKVKLHHQHHHSLNGAWIPSLRLALRQSWNLSQRQHSPRMVLPLFGRAFCERLFNRAISFQLFHFLFQ